MPQAVVTFKLPKRSDNCPTCKSKSILRKFPSEDFWIELDFSAELGEDTIASVAEATDGGTGLLSTTDAPEGAGTSAHVMVDPGATASTGSIRVDILTTMGNRISGVVDFLILPDPTEEYGANVPASALSNYYTKAQVNAKIGLHRTVNPATGSVEWNTSEGSVIALYMTGDVTLDIDNDENRTTLSIITIQDGTGGHSLTVHTSDTVYTLRGGEITLSSGAGKIDVVSMVSMPTGVWLALTAADFREAGTGPGGSISTGDLEGGVADPDASQYYGTNASDVVGFHDLPSIGGATQLTDLTDVTAKTGTGTTVVMSVSPSVTGVLDAATIDLSNGTKDSPSLQWGDDNSGFYSIAPGLLSYAKDTVTKFLACANTGSTPANVLRLDDSMGIGWSTDPDNENDEVRLFRSAVDTIALVGVASEGDVSFGIGTSAPSSIVHIAKETSRTDDLETLITLEHTTTGTPSGGIGSAIDVIQQTGVGNNETIGRFRWVTTSVASTSETSKFGINLIVGGSLQESFEVADDYLKIRSSKTPASSSATGTQGQISWDSDYLYVCTATDTWKRTALATW